MSSFQEFLDATEHDGVADSDIPSLGQLSADTVRIDTKNTVIKYFSGCFENETDALMAEHIMTSSLRTRANLTNVGDIVVISETGTFDKDGGYHILIKYMELVEEVTP